MDTIDTCINASHSAMIDPVGAAAKIDERLFAIKYNFKIVIKNFNTVNDQSILPASSRCFQIDYLLVASF